MSLVFPENSRNCQNHNLIEGAVVFAIQVYPKSTLKKNLSVSLWGPPNLFYVKRPQLSHINKFDP